MEYYQQRRILVLAVVVLVILNVGSLGMIWQNQGFKSKASKTANYNNGIEFLDEELNLSDEQLTTFRRLRREHFDNSRQISQELRRAKKDFLQKMTSHDREDELIKDLAQDIGKIHAKRDLELFGHFQDLKAVCNEEQRVRLAEIFEQFMKKSAPKMGMPGGRPGEGRPPHPRNREGDFPPPHGDMPPPHPSDF